MFGVKPDGTSVGQEISDQTLREIAQAMNGFEPLAHVETERVRLKSGREVLILHIEGQSDTVPFTFEGRAFSSGNMQTSAPAGSTFPALKGESSGRRQ